MVVAGPKRPTLTPATKGLGTVDTCTMLTCSLDSKLTATMCYLGDVNVILGMNEIDTITVVCRPKISTRNIS